MNYAAENLLLWMSDLGIACDGMERRSYDQNMPLASVIAASDVAAASLGGCLHAELKLLEEEVRNFTGCPLKTDNTNTVFADGSPESDIMIIGEAPGANEDKEGIPFCGLSGKLLNQMLSAIGLPRQNVYITNVVFWRPDNNKKPTREEVDACMPLVERHIALVRPKVLLLLGSTAANALLDPDLSVTSMRGRSFLYTNKFMSDNIVTFVSYHPSYLLRQPLRKRDAWNDFINVKHALLSNMPGYKVC